MQLTNYAAALKAAEGDSVPMISVYDLLNKASVS